MDRTDMTAGGSGGAPLDDLSPDARELGLTLDELGDLLDGGELQHVPVDHVPSQEEHSAGGAAWGPSDATKAESKLESAAVQPFSESAQAGVDAADTQKGDPKGESGEKAPEKPGSKNAAWCRKHRQRRKRQFDELRVRNEELEAERELFLTRIADLTSEAETLRMHNSVDLEVENQLLKVEIKRFKRIANKIADVIDDVEMVSPEERVRTLQNGLQSATSQLLGLSYMSSFREGNQWSHFNAFEPEDGVPVKIVGGFQLLPHGSTLQESKRFNQRIDFREVPVSQERLTKWHHEFMFDFDAQRKAMATQELGDGIVRDVESVDLPPELVDLHLRNGGEHVHLVRYTETHKATGDLLAESIMYGSHATVEVFPKAMGLPHLAQDGDAHAPVKAVLFFITNTSVDLVLGTQDAKSCAVSGLSMSSVTSETTATSTATSSESSSQRFSVKGGLILAGRTPETSTFVSLASFPTAMLQTSATMRSMSHPVDESGNMHPLMKMLLEQQWKQLSAMFAEEDVG